MFERPNVDDLMTTAEAIGFTLDRNEARLYQANLVRELAAFDEFLSARMDECPPPVTYPEREPGHRPTAEEDPYNAWMWKCRIEGASGGLLAGKTVSYKDHTAVAGVPCSFGTYALEGFVPDFDATTVTRVLAAGGTIIGKNTMDGLAGGKGYNGNMSGDYGRPLNPHNPAYLTGGSSSGSGAALAAGEVDIAFGGDQGGSIRSPASWCGVVGLKPTFGLVSHFGVGFGSEPSIDYTGPMARTVRDTAAALQAVTGPDGLDPRQSRDVPETLDVLSALDDGVAGLRIAVVDEGFDDGTEPDVRDAVLEAVDVLARAGAVVSKVSLPEHRTVRRAAAALGPEGARSIFDGGFTGGYARTYYPTKLVASVMKMNRHGAGALPARTKMSLLTSEYSRRNFHGAVYAKAHNVRTAFIAAVDAALIEHDVLVMPTSPTVAKPWEPPSGPYLEQLAKALEPMTRNRNRQPFNYTGHPALSIPCGKSGGLPIGLQLIGRFFDDGLLLRTAQAYQACVDWDALITPQS
jgi:amidase